MRSCTRNTPNYSDTHKGISPNQFKGRKGVINQADKSEDHAQVTDFDLTKVTVLCAKPLESGKPERLEVCHAEAAKPEQELTLAIQASSPAEPKSRTGVKRSSY